jgi:hypothetical protein
MRAVVHCDGRSWLHSKLINRTFLKARNLLAILLGFLAFATVSMDANA